MQKLAKIDLWGQLIVFFGTLAYALFTFRGEQFFALYFTIGGWQFLFTLIYLIIYPFSDWTSGRKTYTLILFITGALVILAFMLDFAVAFMLLLLLFSPILAIWNFFLAYEDSKS